MGMIKRFLASFDSIDSDFNLLERTQDMARKRRNKNHKAKDKPRTAKAKGATPAVKKIPPATAQGGKSTASQVGYYGAWKDCHGATLVNAFDIGKVSIYLGAKADFRMHNVSLSGQWTLVLNLAGIGRVGLPPVIEANPAAQRILPDHLTSPVDLSTPELEIDWPDGGVPYDLPESWYGRLVDWIKEQESGNVAIVCQGGHGRTGTLAVILAGLAGVIPPRRCPVGWLRDSYCDDAVETKTQIALIEQILDRRVWEHGAWESTYGGWSKDPNNPHKNPSPSYSPYQQAVTGSTGVNGHAIMGPKPIGATHTINDSGCIVPKIESPLGNPLGKQGLENELTRIRDEESKLESDLDAAYMRGDWERAAEIELDLADIVQARVKLSNRLESLGVRDLFEDEGDESSYSDLLPYGQKASDSF